MIETEKFPYIEEVTPLKQSEALRLGGMQYAQCRGAFVQNTTDDSWQVCALGAMAIGYGSTPQEILDEGYDFDGRQFFDGGTDMIRCPVRHSSTHLLRSYMPGYHNLIAHLNDDHHWSFGQIADYLESQGL